MYVHPDIQDKGLEEFEASCNKIVLCNAEPTTYTEANATFMIGYKNTPTVGAPDTYAGPPAGRACEIAAITDGVVDSADTATWQAALDTTTSRILAKRVLPTPKALVTGDPWTSDEWYVIGKNAGL